MREHNVWWTAIPALPVDRETPEWAVLRRLWDDHTLNTVGGARGIYRPSTEDHLLVSLFQCFAIFLNDLAWAPTLLRQFGQVPHGDITAIRWSYHFEQPRHLDPQRRIVDLVVAWRDAAGDAVLLVEAKGPNTKLGPKDLADPASYYGSMPAFAAYKRRGFAFLLDAQGRHGRVPDDVPRTTWQALGNLLIELAGAETEPVRAILVKTLANHLARLGVMGRTTDNPAEGTAARYAALRALSARPAVVNFLLGAEAAAAHAAGRSPEPPFPWLAETPDRMQVSMRKRQPKTEREAPLWRLD